MAVLALTVFATISATLIIPPLLVEIASDLEISVAVAGQLATATFAGWAIMVVSGGPLSDFVRPPPRGPGRVDGPFDIRPGVRLRTEPGNSVGVAGFEPVWPGERSLPTLWGQYPT